MTSTKILIATTVSEDHRKRLIAAASSLRAMLPAKSTAVTMQSMNRPKPACLAYLDPKPNTGPRKRQRLNHLSPDEKLMRRKMKNRVAAQTARDRKKALMERLEDKIYEFEVQQTQIIDENTALRARNQTLEIENKELRCRLGLEEMDTDSQCEDTISVTVKEETESPESAAGADSTSFIAADNDVHIEPDVLLGILGEINGQGLLDEGPESVGLTPEGGILPSPGSPDPSAVAPALVGTTAADMESIKELIKFDHEYYKRPMEAAIKQETKNMKPVDKSVQLPQKMVAESALTQQLQKLGSLPESQINSNQSMDIEYLLSLSDSTDSNNLAISNPFAAHSQTATFSDIEGDRFDCDISQLLMSEDLEMCDTFSDSGKSTGSSDSGVASDDPPSSPDFAIDPLGSPTMPICDWEDSFIDLFPTLDM